MHYLSDATRSIDMSEHTQNTTKGAAAASVTRGLLLQRKCACGQHTIAGGECEECRKKREGALQRSANAPALVSDVPPIVHEVLRSPGQPLDAPARAFMEPRFAQDFSGVRVHTGAQAAESARAVNALAYTVGRDVVFGDRQYAPSTATGQRLLAHELTHVVQQNASSMTSAAGLSAIDPRPAMENEARVAEVAIHGTAPMSGSPMAGAALQRQPTGGQRTPPQPTSPNTRQLRIIDAARRAAAIRCQTALFRVGGIVPPGPSRAGDAATMSQMRARALAQVMFDWADPNMEQISEVVGSMVTFLTSGVQTLIAPANDPECGNRAAYVRGLRPPIVLCPAFFSDGPEQQIRTMIHEAAHLARIGRAALGESYCVDFDCTTSCGGFDSADSWAHFVHCLSGQAPDQPMTIQGRAPAGSQRQSPQRGAGAQQ
jgi:hypothetical protein